MATITSLGAGTQLDLESILEKLSANNDDILKQISARQQSYEVKISSFSQLQSSVQSLQDAAQALGSDKTMNAVKSAATGDSITVAATDGAAPGQYAVTIDRIATAQHLQSASPTSRSESHGAHGTLEITLQNGTTTTIDLTDTSLDGVAKAINANDEVGVHATLINDGDNGAYLMLSAEDTGLDNAVSTIVVSQDSGDLGTWLNYDAAQSGGGMISSGPPAQDALLTINGIQVRSASNHIDDAVDGVTFNISPDAAEGDTATVTVSRDTSAITNAVKQFVNAYNALQTTLYSLTAFDVDAETQNPLTGDGTARSIQTTLASALQVVSGDGALQTLGALGITTNPDKVSGVGGTLVVDQDNLDAALKNNPADVARILAGPNGLAASIQDASRPILGTGGAIKTRQDGLQKTADTLQLEHDNTKTRMDAELDNMRQQFVQLSVLVAQMNSTSSYLTQQFASLSSSTNK